MCESVGERWRDGAGSLVTFGFSTRWCGMAQVHRRPTYGGRFDPRCGDPDRGTAVIRLGTACASAARVAEPVLGLSHFSTRWCGMAQVHGHVWREGHGEDRRCKPARSFLQLGTGFAVFDGRLEKRVKAGVCGEGCRFRTSNVEYVCSPAFRMCWCECCVRVLCVRPCRCQFSVCARVDVRATT